MNVNIETIDSICKVAGFKLLHEIQKHVNFTQHTIVHVLSWHPALSKASLSYQNMLCATTSDNPEFN